MVLGGLLGCTASPAAPPPTPAGPTAIAVRPGTEDQTWFRVRQATQAYSIHGDQLWVAQPGNWYRVVDRRPGWLLAVYEEDSNFWSVWIEQDPKIQLTNGRPLS